MSRSLHFTEDGFRPLRNRNRWRIPIVANLAPCDSDYGVHWWHERGAVFRCAACGFEGLLEGSSAELQAAYEKEKADKERAREEAEYARHAARFRIGKKRRNKKRPGIPGTLRAWANQNALNEL